MMMQQKQKNGKEIERERERGGRRKLLTMVRALFTIRVSSCRAIDNIFPLALFISKFFPPPSPLGAIPSSCSFLRPAAVALTRSAALDMADLIWWPASRAAINRYGTSAEITLRPTFFVVKIEPNYDSLRFIGLRWRMLHCTIKPTATFTRLEPTFIFRFHLVVFPIFYVVVISHVFLLFSNQQTLI